MKKELLFEAWQDSDGEMVLRFGRNVIRRLAIDFWERIYNSIVHLEPDRSYKMHYGSVADTMKMVEILDPVELERITRLIRNGIKRQKKRQEKED